MPLTGYYDPRVTPGMLGSSMGSGNYTDYSGYNPNGLQSSGYGNATGSGYDAATQAAVDARDKAVYSNSSGRGYTVDTVGPDGKPVHMQGVAAPFNNAANAPSWQPLGYAGEVAPGIPIATNRNVLGAGAYGVRNWMRENPLGVIGAFTGLAAGGAALAGLGGGAAAPAASSAAAPASAAGSGSAAAAGSAAGGLQTSSGLGYFANGGAAGMAGVGGGNAGALAASGAINGGAGLGSLGGLLASRAGDIGSLLGAAAGGQGAPAAPSMPPLGMLGSQMQPQQPQQAPQRQQAILPGMSQSPMQGFSRRPYQFHGATIWM